jgi:hypothetical protein
MEQTKESNRLIVSQHPSKNAYRLITPHYLLLYSFAFLPVNPLMGYGNKAITIGHRTGPKNPLLPGIFCAGLTCT